jgi:Uma2 family endonuclease
MATVAVPQPPISRAQYYALAPTLDPHFRYELLDGVIDALSPANPPHASVVRYLARRLGGETHAWICSVQDVLEIEPDCSPQPDIALLRFRVDYYSARHPNGGDTLLVIEVGDTERNPQAKMTRYMRDGRIPEGWRIDIPGRRVELWSPTLAAEPYAIRTGQQRLTFGDISIEVDDMFAGLPA